MGCVGSKNQESQQAPNKTLLTDKPETLLTDKPENKPAEVSEVSEASEAEGLLKKLFDGIDADEDGTISVAELAMALKKADLDLAALLDAACMNSSFYVMDRLEADRDSRISWDAFKSSLWSAFGIKSGDMVVDASTRARCLVVKRTTTEVELVMPDASKVWRDMEDVRIAPVSEAEASLRKVFDGIDADKNGMVSAEELTAALEAEAFGLAGLLEAAGLDSRCNVMAQLDANKDGQLSWSEFKSSLFLARDLKIGDTAVVSSTGARGCVVNWTATEVQLEMADGSQLWQDIADLDVGVFRKDPAAPAESGGQAPLVEAEAAEAEAPPFVVESTGAEAARSPWCLRCC